MLVKFNGEGPEISYALGMEFEPGGIYEVPENFNNPKFERVIAPGTRPVRGRPVVVETDDEDDVDKDS